MTRKGHKELTDQERAELAQLMWIHLETHPSRVGPLYGVDGQHVREMWRQHWREHVSARTPTMQEALTALRERVATWRKMQRRPRAMA